MMSSMSKINCSILLLIVDLWLVVGSNAHDHDEDDDDYYSDYASRAGTSLAIQLTIWLVSVFGICMCVGCGVFFGFRAYKKGQFDAIIKKSENGAEAAGRWIQETTSSTQPPVAAAYQTTAAPRGSSQGGVVACDVCHQDGTRFDRLKCATCPDFDLCHECYYNINAHWPHQFLQFSPRGGAPISLGPRVRRQAPAGEIPTNPLSSSFVGEGVVKCDACGHMGTRFDTLKCATCNEFDLCNDCYQAGAHMAHQFLQPSICGGPPIHLGPRSGATNDGVVVCDFCQQVGTRFDRLMCATCDDFDLCSECYHAGAHMEHQFLKLGRLNDPPTLLDARQNNAQLQTPNKSATPTAPPHFLVMDASDAV